MYLLWLFIALGAIFTFSCLKYGATGLLRNTVPITAGKSLKGFHARAISSVITLFGVLSGIYLLNGLATMAYFYLKHRRLN